MKPDGNIRIVDSGHRRKLEIAVEVPRDELGAVASNEMWGEIYDRIAELILVASHHAGFRQHAPTGRTSGSSTEQSGLAIGRGPGAPRKLVARAAPRMRNSD